MARIGELIGPNGEVIHPKTSASVVYLEDGRSVEQILSEDIDYGNIVFQDTSCKISSDIEDDFAKTVVIKGQTYQNILPEPSLRNSMNNGKTMQKFNEGYDSVNVVDGVGKHAILKGQTLVNVHQQTLGRCTLNCTRQYIQYTIEAAKNPMMSLGKTYLYILDVIENTANSSARWNNYLSTISNGSYIIQAGQTGRLVFKVNFREDAGNPWKYNWFEFGDKLDNYTGHIVFTLAIIPYQEGMENWDIPYFDGMKSVKSPSLVSVGKNLFNGSVFESDHVKLVSTDDRNCVEITARNEISGIFKFSKLLECDLGATISGTLKHASGGYVKLRPIYEDDTIGEAIGNWALCENWIHKAYTIPASSKKLKGFILMSASNANKILIDLKTLQIEQGAQATTYEPHKLNTLTTPSDLVLRRIGDVYDTLDLVSGEKVERIGEIVLDGGYFVEAYTHNDETHTSFIVANVFSENKVNRTWYSTSGFNFNTYGSASLYVSKVPHSLIGSNKGMSATERANCFKKFIINNPIEIFYTLDEPTITQIPLTSSGNWEKVILDGSESWHLQSNSANSLKFNIPLSSLSIVYDSLMGKVNGTFSSYLKWVDTNVTAKEGHRILTNGQLVININKEKLLTQDVTGFKQWLHQNPVEIYYPLAASQTNSIKEMLSFSNGHIQFSSEKGSLIPNFDYEIPTSNSYHMGLMKANTLYTMKANSVNGDFSIDGKTYTLNKNTKFTSPSSLNNRVMIVKGSAVDLMILEGDLTSKITPYFEGIKSTFEGEDKIEILSTGKNLFNPYSPFDTDYYGSEWKCLSCRYDHEKELIVTEGVSGHKNSKFQFLKFKPNTSYTFSGNIVGHQHRFCVHNESKQKEFNGTGHFSLTVTTGNSGRLYVSVLKVGTPSGVYGIENLQIEESSTQTMYESHKSNVSKILSLSPLRSLPNGVCDELIIDRTKKRATWIQRVGIDTCNGSEVWVCYNESSSKTVEGYHHTVENLGGGANNTNLLCNNFPANDRSIHIRDEAGVGSHQDKMYSNIRICISKTELLSLGYTVGQDRSMPFKKWLQMNPVIILYPLLVPVVTEIDLENFPLVYKNGHIFLNSEIAPVVGLEYSVNQGHRIEGQTETLQRHEQQFTQLERYFADLVYSDYNLTLLRFNKKLHQEEGDV